MKDSAKLYSEANILFYEKHDREAALAAYKKIILEFPDSSEANHAKSQMETIGKPTQKEEQAPTGRPTQYRNSSQPSSSASTTLKFFAWFEFIAGFLGGAIIVITMQNAMGAIIGLAVALQALLIWAVMMVLAEMAENLIQIRRNTSTQTNK